MEIVERKGLVDTGHPALSISCQCALLSLSRSGWYYQAGDKSADKTIMDAIDRIMTEFPYYGSRKVTAELCEQGYSIGRYRVRRLLGQMGLRATQPKKHKGGHRKEHVVYPYLLENLVSRFLTRSGVRILPTFPPGTGGDIWSPFSTVLAERFCPGG